MGYSDVVIATLALPLLLLLLLLLPLEPALAQLSYNFYARSCPNVEKIVWSATARKFRQHPNAAPGTVRLLFHDCFVEGCDASVLLASTPGDKAEKDSPENLSLSGDGFDAVIRAKTAVEAVCPNTVSCADILVMVTRDLIRMAGGPYYTVEKGRRDGRISKASLASANLPGPNFSHDQLTSSFRKRGLSTVDLVALVGGGHTIGFVHCTSLLERLYSFKSANKVDPLLNATYAEELKSACPRDVDPIIAIDFDPITPKKLDNAFFKLIQQNKGLLRTDQILYTDPRTQNIVNSFAKANGQFFKQFVTSITTLSRLGVKTGTKGEIRKNCSFVN